MTVVPVYPFRRPVAQPPRLRLLCLPYAGGSAALYRLWPKAFAPDVEAIAVELPGRGVRFREQAIADIASLCDSLMPEIESLLDLPLALFGHSMGARIAFELARRLDARGDGKLVHLFVSASLEPGTLPRYVQDDRRMTATLSDAEFKQRLRTLGGTPPEIMDDDLMMARVLPMLRADLTLIESYRPAPELTVSCPITMFAGELDRQARPDEVTGWKQRTRAPHAQLRQLGVPAGHFYLDSHRDLLINEVQRTLRSTT